MNRRAFISTGAASLFALPLRHAFALDEEPIESPLMELLDQIPDRTGSDGFAFSPSLAFDHPIRRMAPGEVPDMYWDPYGEDLGNIFGFHTIAILHSAVQRSPDVLEFWRMDAEWMNAAPVITSLEANGWQTLDQDLRLMAYVGSKDDRRERAASLNMVGKEIADGSWDHIALPDDRTIVLGANPELVRKAADRVKYHTALTPIRQNFHSLGSVLPVHTYEMKLLPPEALPISDATATFVCRSYETDAQIIHSVGVRTESPGQAQNLIDEMRQLFSNAISPEREQPYREFLDLIHVFESGSAARFDFVVTDGDWDIVRAAESEDLLMFPGAD